MALIVIPDGCSVSPPNAAVRLMPSWDNRYPRPECDGEHTHDWKMRAGVACLFICRHCRAAGWLAPMAEIAVTISTGPRRFWAHALGHA